MDWREQEWKPRDQLKDYCNSTRNDGGLGDDSTGDRSRCIQVEVTAIDEGMDWGRGWQ